MDRASYAEIEKASRLKRELLATHKRARLEELYDCDLQSNTLGKFFRVTHTVPLKLKTHDPERSASTILSELKGIGMQELLFLDLETLGFSPGEPIICLGLARLTERGMAIHQYIPRRTNDEPAVLLAATEPARATRVLVTYNGRTFDLPRLSARLMSHGLPAFRDLRHLDLLHQSRRQFKDTLPDTKLKTIANLDFHTRRMR